AGRKSGRLHHKKLCDALCRVEAKDRKPRPTNDFQKVTGVPDPCRDLRESMGDLTFFPRSKAPPCRTKRGKGGAPASALHTTRRDTSCISSPNRTGRDRCGQLSPGLEPLAARVGRRLRQPSGPAPVPGAY